jgi:hypothetical protein
MFAVDDRLGALQKRYLAVKATDIAELSACKSEKQILLTECERLKKKCKRLEQLWLQGEIRNSSLKSEFAETFRYIENMTARVNGIQIRE